MCNECGSQHVVPVGDEMECLACGAAWVEESDGKCVDGVCKL